MPATIIPFRSRNPETDLLARRNAEEAKRLLREDGGMDFDRKGPRAPGARSFAFSAENYQWALSQFINPSPDNGAA